MADLMEDIRDSTALTLFTSSFLVGLGIDPDGLFYMIVNKVIEILYLEQFEAIYNNIRISIFIVLIVGPIIITILQIRKVGPIGLVCATFGFLSGFFILDYNLIGLILLVIGGLISILFKYI